MRNKVVLDGGHLPARSLRVAAAGANAMGQVSLREIIS
jgi:hypothetical protein